MTVKERLKEYLKYRSISQGKFESTVGLSNGYVNNIRKSIQPDKIQRISLCFPDLNTGWLLTGEGEMLKKGINEVSHIFIDNSSGEFILEKNGTNFYQLKNGLYRMNVPLVPFNAYGRFANESDHLDPDKENWGRVDFEFEKIVQGEYYAFEIKGNSMDDGKRHSFEEGDIVLARKLEKNHWRDGLRIKQYPYWVIVFESSVLIKEIIDVDINTGVIICHSLNNSPEYSDFPLHLDKIRALYNVVQKNPKSIKY